MSYETYRALQIAIGLGLVGMAFAFWSDQQRRDAVRPGYGQLNVMGSPKPTNGTNGGARVYPVRTY